MKKLSFEDFNTRMLEIQKARKIFVDSGLTNNISIAFEAYRELLMSDEDKEKYPERINSKSEKTPFDGLNVPKCDECGNSLKLTVNSKDIEGNTHRTAWKCKKCGMIYYSDKTSTEWYQILKGAENENRK
jgi:uncharacterized protein with PIN domain